MRFNETKSRTMLISRKRNNENININLNNRLELVKEMKYLGIYFNSRLTFDKRIPYTAEYSTKLIHMLRRSAKRQWVLGHKSLKPIYEGALIALLTYRAPVWNEDAVKRRNLRMLHRVQRMINIKKGEGVQNYFLRSFMHDGWSSIHRNCNRGEGEAVQNKAQCKTK